MKEENKFSEEAVKAFEADGKVGLLATADADGLPHITLITAMQANGPDELIFGQFCEGAGKENPQHNRQTGFLVMGMDRRLWRGTAVWREKKESGPEKELMNSKPMWRYNSYFSMHTVHYLDLVSVSPMQKVKMFPIIRGLAVRLLRPRLRNGGVMNRWTRRFVSAPGHPKFIAYIDTSGFPRFVPAFAAFAVSTSEIFLPGTEFREDFNKIPDGVEMALFAMSLEMEDVVVRGRFSRKGTRAVLEIKRIYNSMPPVAGQIYPPLETAGGVSIF